MHVANLEPMLSTRELAIRLAVSEDHIRAMAREGRIPSLRLGHHTRRYSVDAVLAALGADGPGQTGGQDGR